MKKIIIFIFIIILLTSCGTPMTLEERKEETKQWEIRQKISKQKTDAITNDMGKYYLGCNDICTPGWTSRSRALCITNCVNSLKKEEIRIKQ